MKQLTRRSSQLSCFVELTTGTALVLLPAVVIQLLLGTSLPDGGLQLAQLYGAALIGLRHPSTPCAPGTLANVPAALWTARARIARRRGVLRRPCCENEAVAKPKPGPVLCGGFW